LAVFCGYHRDSPDIAPMILLRILLLGLFSASLAAEEPWYDAQAPDQGDWSAKRIETYDEYSTTEKPLAVIKVDALAIEAQVFPDSRPGALEMGAAWLAGTALPGASGNTAIAGHRDSCFRKLEGVSPGARIDLITGQGSQQFEVNEVSIVDALDVSPLDDTDANVLTLITCYPFYYRGFAPDLYIVRARRIPESTSAELADSAE